MLNNNLTLFLLIDLNKCDVNFPKEISYNDVQINIVPIDIIDFIKQENIKTYVDKLLTKNKKPIEVLKCILDHIYFKISAKLFLTCEENFILICALNMLFNIRKIYLIDYLHMFNLDNIETLSNVNFKILYGIVYGNRFGCKFRAAFSKIKFNYIHKQFHNFSSFKPEKFSSLSDFLKNKNILLCSKMFHGNIFTSFAESVNIMQIINIINSQSIF